MARKKAKTEIFKVEDPPIERCHFCGETDYTTARAKSLAHLKYCAECGLLMTVWDYGKIADLMEQLFKINSARHKMEWDGLAGLYDLYPQDTPIDQHHNPTEVVLSNIYRLLSKTLNEYSRLTDWGLEHEEDYSEARKRHWDLILEARAAYREKNKVVSLAEYKEQRA
jgi:hypothetical protein